jgi:hypothetical protein
MAAVAACKSPVPISLIASRMVRCMVSSFNSFFLSDAIGKGGLDLGAGRQGAEDFQRLDCGARKSRRNVVGNSNEAQYAELQWVCAGNRMFELLFCDVPQSDHQRLAGDRLAYGFGVHRKLIANRGPNEIRAVGVEALDDQEIDLAQIYQT